MRARVVPRSFSSLKAGMTMEIFMDSRGRWGAGFEILTALLQLGGIAVEQNLVPRLELQLRLGADDGFGAAPDGHGGGPGARAQLQLPNLPAGGNRPGANDDR